MTTLLITSDEKTFLKGELASIQILYHQIELNDTNTLQKAQCKNLLMGQSYDFSKLPKSPFSEHF